MTITYTPQYRLTNLGSFTAIPSTTLTTATFTSLSAGTSYDFRVVADNGVGQSTSVPFTQITTAVSESAQNASITQSNYTTSFIYDANLVQWSLQTPNSFSIYSSPPPYTALTQSLGTNSVVLLLYWNHTVYQQNSSGNWWSWTGTAWNPTSDPRPTIVSVNLTNNTFPQGAGAATVVGNITVTENTGNTFSGSLGVTGTNSSFFTINASNQLVTVGSVPVGGPWSINIVATSNQLAVQNSPFSQPESISETSGESIEGTVVNTIGPIINASPNFGQASTGTLNQFELQTSVSSGNQIYYNPGSGFVQTQSGNVSQLLYHNHTVFQENTNLNWWYWNTTISFPTANPWTPFSVNSVALNATTYPTGATAGSQVGSITINETGDTFGGTFGGTLSLSGTNSSNFAISGTNLVVAPGVTLSTNTATNYSFTITATVASGGSTPTTIGTQNTGTITLTNSASVSLTQVPLGIHLGPWLGGGAQTYPSVNAHWLGVISALNRTPAMCNAVFNNSYLDYKAPTSSWGLGDVSTWTSASIPVDGSVAPFLHAHWTDGATTDQDYTNVLNGTYDTPLTNGLNHWKIGIKKLYFRINWEFNANFYGNAPAQNQISNYVASWKRWCNIIHTWGNQNGIVCRMVWSPDTSYSSSETSTFSLPVINYFPQPDSNAVNGRYIDVIGHDWYMNGYSVRSNFSQGLTTPLSSNTNWSPGTFAQMAQVYNCNIGISETGDGANFADNDQSATDGFMASWAAYHNTLSTLSPKVAVEYVAIFDVNAGGATQFTNGGAPTVQAGWRCCLGVGGTQPSTTYTIPVMTTVPPV